MGAQEPPQIVEAPIYGVQQLLQEQSNIDMQVNHDNARHTSVGTTLPVQPRSLRSPPSHNLKAVVKEISDTKEHNCAKEAIYII